MLVKSFSLIATLILRTDVIVMVHGHLHPDSEIRQIFTRSLKEQLGNGSRITADDIEGFYYSKHLIWNQIPVKTFTDCLDDLPGRRLKDQELCLLETCLSPDDVFKLSGLSHGTSDEEVSIMSMILLHLLENKSCLQKLQKSHTLEEHWIKPSPSEIWGYGVLCTSIIALTAFGGVLALPFIHGLAYKRTLIYLTGLAIGTLAGSSLFFLIHEAFGHTEHEMHQPTFVWKSLIIGIAIYASFLIERVLKRKNGRKKGKPVIKDLRNIEVIEQEDKHINDAAWVIIAGDALHNFIDGVSVGAAFTDCVLAGVSVTVALFCEELPHEIGDFAILLCEGLTRKQAIICNTLSACAIYIGLVVGVYLGLNDTCHDWVFAFAAGMFLYVALVDMMPEMCAVGQLEENKRLIGTGIIFLLQNLGLVSGFGIIFVLAKYQGNIEEAITNGSG